MVITIPRARLTEDLPFRPYFAPVDDFFLTDSTNYFPASVSDDI